jgi:hypothetical protein
MEVRVSSSDIAIWVGAIATFLGVIATFLAVLVALFKEDVRSLWRRPVLKARILLAPPDCHKTELISVNQATGQILGRWPCYYFRIWVENTGIQRAEQVQVFAAGLSRRQADGTFKQETQFLPMNLRWAHSQQRPGGPEIFALGISPGMGKHCDLGHMPHPEMRRLTNESLPNVPADQTILSLDLEVAPIARSHLIAPGMYRLLLRLAAANSKPVEKTIEINITGQWHDDETRMFSDGIGLREP